MQLAMMKTIKLYKNRINAFKSNEFIFLVLKLIDKNHSNDSN